MNIQFDTMDKPDKELYHKSQAFVYFKISIEKMYEIGIEYYLIEIVLFNKRMTIVL